MLGDRSHGSVEPSAPTSPRVVRELDDQLHPTAAEREKAMSRASITIAALSIVLVASGGPMLCAGQGTDLHSSAAAKHLPLAGLQCGHATAIVALPAYAPVAPTGVTIVVPDDYATIQSAVDNAAPGDTVFVRAGTYFEHVLLNKQLTLLGEDAATTLIDGGGTDHVMRITASGASVNGFTVQNSGSGSSLLRGGITLNSVQNVHVAQCRFISNQVGAYFCNVAYSVLEKSVFDDNGLGVLTDFDITTPECPGWFHANRITGNVFHANFAAISFSHIYENDENVVQGNIITDNTYGISITVADYNEFSYNTLLNNTNYGLNIDICFCGAYNNRIHHNNFVDNCSGGVQAHETTSLGINYWYSPEGVGNFWSDYTGSDANHDGLGDTAYVIPAGGHNDLYPLMRRYLPGDLDLDGAVNAFDIDPFVLALTDPAAYHAQFLLPAGLHGDCNFDGELNTFDIDPFVYCLTHPDEIVFPPNP
jgi:nitrous oxidase accessory protein